MITAAYGATGEQVIHIDTVNDLETFSGIQAGDVYMVEERANAIFETVLSSTVTANGFDIIESTADSTYSFELRFGHAVYMDQVGAVKGTSTSIDNTAVFNRAKTLSEDHGLPIVFGGGTYRGQYNVDSRYPMIGAGKRQTILIPSQTDYCVKLYGVGGDNGLGVVFRDFGLDGGISGSSATVGLYCGDASGIGFSNAEVSNLEIKRFSQNWFLRMAIMSTFRNIWSHDATVSGVEIDSEANVTTCHLDTCRITTNREGGIFRGGHCITMTNCNFESNQIANARFIAGLNSGPTNWVINGCWFEDMTAHSGVVASIVFDMNTSIATSKAMNMIFNRCVITSPEGEADINADRAQKVIFDHCNFSVGGFNATKLVYATGTDAVSIKLIQCGNIQAMPTATMYASFPALTLSNGSYYGFSYEFEDPQGRFYTNPELDGVLNISSDATSLDVRGIDTLVVDTSGGDVDINSLANGVDGQIIRIIKTSTLNTVTLVHNGTGQGKIYGKTSGHTHLSVRTGSTLAHYGGVWYQVVE